MINMSKEAGVALLPGQTNGFQLTKSKINACRLVLLTSLLWVFIDAFIILFYLNDCGLNMSSSPDCRRCEFKLERLERELNSQRKAYSSLLQRSPRLDSLVNRTERLEKLKLFKYQSPESLLGKDELPEIFRSDDENEAKKIKSVKDWFKEDFSLEKNNPSDWPGENGRPVVIPDKLKKEAEKRFVENQFNVVASDLIALNRSIPDQRSEVYVIISPSI